MESRLVRLAHFDRAMEAELCVAMLDAYGIFAMTPARFVHSGTATVLRGEPIPVQVASADYEAAKALLEQVNTQMGESEQ